MMTPVVFTVTILHDNISVENVKQEILNISTAQEIIDFNPVGRLSNLFMYVITA